MSRLSNERGYALLIVFFSIIFITVITAVFMRGALSNIKQENIVDENNLVVVSAEAGLDYYTWELNQVYDKKELDKEFKTLIADLVNNRDPEDIVEVQDYDNIRITVAKKFFNKLKIRGDQLRVNLNVNPKPEPEKEERLFSSYYHQLGAANIRPSKNSWQYDPTETITIVVEGTVDGNKEGERDPKQLAFELNYNFPPLDYAKVESPSPGPNETVPKDEVVEIPTDNILKTPKKPVLPQVAIDLAVNNKPTSECIGSNETKNQKCVMSKNSLENWEVVESKILIDKAFSSAGKTDIVKSYMHFGGVLNSTYTNVVDSELYIGGAYTAKSSEIVKSKVEIKGSITSNEKFNVKDRSNLSVDGSADVGHTAIKKSIVEIKGNLITRIDETEIHESDVTIGANFIAYKGLDIDESTLKIVSSLEINDLFGNGDKRLKSKKSDIYVGYNVDATTGSELDSMDMVVGNNYTSTGKFDLQKVNLTVDGTLKLKNISGHDDVGEIHDKSVIVAKRIENTKKLDIQGSSIYTGYLGTGKLAIQQSKVCTKILDANPIEISSGEIYYTKAGAKLSEKDQKNEKIIQLTSEEYEKKCFVQYGTTPKPSEPGTSNPQAPPVINWQNPVLEKVEY